MNNTVFEATTRYNMWCRLIPSYSNMKKNQKKKARIAYAKANTDTGFPGDVESIEPDEPTSTSLFPSPILDWDYAIVEDRLFYADIQVNMKTHKLAPLGKGSIVPPKVLDLMDLYSATQPKKQEETTMYTETETQRRYLESRLSNTYSVKLFDLRKHFHIDRFLPSSMKEAVELLKAGKYTLDEKRMENYQEEYGEDMGFDVYSFAHIVLWDLEPADKAGFKAATESLEKVYTDARDTIKIASPEKGLEALKAFEAATFH